MKKIFKYILNFLIPPTCPVCHKEGTDSGLCPKCYSELEFIGTQKCAVCGRPLDIIIPEIKNVCAMCLKDPPHFRQAEAVFRYNDLIKKLILPFKHGDHIELIDLFVKLMSINNNKILQNNQVIIPVPLHWSRLLKRKYNQSALLAQRLSKKYNKIYAPLVMLRVKSSKSQGHLSPKERKKNVKGIFKVKHPEQIQGKSVLLIDDVFTTGATVNECAKVLLKAGAQSVDVLTIAKA